MSTIATSPSHKTAQPPADNAALKPLAVTIKEAARLLGISERAARRWVRQGSIPAKRIGSRTLCPLAALEALVAVDSDANAENDAK